MLDNQLIEIATTRSLNARIREIAGSFDWNVVPITYHIVCVCGCLQQLDATVNEYDAVGGEVLLPNHSLRNEAQDVERT